VTPISDFADIKLCVAYADGEIFLFMCDKGFVENYMFERDVNTSWE
jgi:hypothetical protein